MSAPSDTTWGNEISSGSNNAGKIGISRVWSDQGTYEHVDVTVWFWSKYSVTDASNSFYYAKDSEPTYQGSVNIKHTVASGSGWSESNQTALATYSYDLTKSSNSYNVTFNASITGIDALGSSNVSYASRLYTVYALPEQPTTIWNDINVLNPSDTQDMLSAYFDLSYSTGYSQTRLLNEPTDGNAYQVPGTVMTISNITPYYDYYELDKVIGADHVGNGVYQHTMTENNEIVEIHMKYISCNVILDANGGVSNITNSITTTYNSDYCSVSEHSVPTRDGYKFIGFFTDVADGQQVYDSNGLCVNGTGYWDNNLWCYKGKSLTLYAHWEYIPSQYIYIEDDKIYARAFIVEENLTTVEIDNQGNIYASAFADSDILEIYNGILYAKSFIVGVPSS